MGDLHSFNVEVAKEVGVNAAILLQGIKWWCEKNRANGKHFHDGLYWTYNSTKAWSELYPYLSKSAINTAMRKLEERGYIKVGNYNKSTYDRTKWYAITESGLLISGQSICRKSEMEAAEIGNGLPESSQPIPVSNQLDNQVVSTVTTSVDDIATEVVTYLNERCGTNYRPSSKDTRRLIHARLKEGFSLEDFKAVIDNKQAQWGRDPHWSQFLRPQTLFGTKFESYLNSAASNKRSTNNSSYAVYGTGVTDFVPIEEDQAWSQR